MSDDRAEYLQGTLIGAPSRENYTRVIRMRYSERNICMAQPCLQPHKATRRGGFFRANPRSKATQMPIFLDVEPRLDNEFAQHVADGVRKAILGALTDITAALSLTDDEKIALQNYRAQRRAQATEAHEVIVMQLNAAQRESDA